LPSKIMSSISSLGIVPNLCETFPLVQELQWRFNPFSGPAEELGGAPSGAYLAMTKEQVVFSFWRVKFWDIVYSFGPINISNTVTLSLYGELFSTSVFSFSVPFTEIVRPATSRTIINEKRLVCVSFAGLIFSTLPIDSDSAVNELPLSVSSLETITLPDESTETNDWSRNSVPSQFRINDFSAGIDAGSWEFDLGQVGDLYYYPFVVSLNMEISNDSSDGLLFAESQEANPAEGESLTGTLPRIAARLTTFPLPNQSGPLTEHKVRFQFSSESDVIELPLYDIETDLTPLTNTGFNLDGFSGITIRPREYWTYDLGDGNGPIYDGTTGAQLREF
jgi:hypothetical protein